MFFCDADGKEETSVAADPIPSLSSPEEEPSGSPGSASVFKSPGFVVGSNAAFADTDERAEDPEPDPGTTTPPSTAVNRTTAAILKPRSQSAGTVGRWKSAGRRASMMNVVKQSVASKAISHDRNLVDASKVRSIDPAFTKSFGVTSRTGGPGVRSKDGGEEALSSVLETSSRPDTEQDTSPVRWWVPRRDDDGDGSIKPTVKHDDKATRKADAGFHWYGNDQEEFHDGFWYDPEAVLSRKASVRFRRSVDVMLPSYDEEVCCCMLVAYHTVPMACIACVSPSHFVLMQCPSCKAPWYVQTLFWCACLHQWLLPFRNAPRFGACASNGTFLLYHA
jgi:hypothetical protein